jgi:hypothetical protein
MIVQDGENEPSPQNFKLISWADVRRTMTAAAQPPKQTGKDGK